MDAWQERIDAAWADDTLTDIDRIDLIDALAAERDADDPAALFERAGARDSAGREAEAEALYRAALAGGLDSERRPQAVIQLASTLRNLGRAAEAAEMLETEIARPGGAPLPDETAAFLALALVSLGKPQEAAAVALRALAPHLSRYTRSVTAYAAELPTRHA
jgi:hypothetical protein